MNDTSGTRADIRAEKKPNIAEQPPRQGVFKAISYNVVWLKYNKGKVSSQATKFYLPSARNMFSSNGTSHEYLGS